MSKGRVVLIDDDKAVLDSLEALLEVAGFEIQAFSSPLAFLDVVASLRPACVVTDVRMPEMSGLDLVKRLADLGCLTWPIIVISGHADVPMAVAAMKAGASSVLEKPVAPEVLIRTILEATAPTANAPPNPDDGDFRARYETLSPREREVLGRAVEGVNSKTIALDLGISHRTVEVFRARILKKMRAPNFTALAGRLARGDQAGQ